MHLIELILSSTEEPKLVKVTLLLGHPMESFQPALSGGLQIELSMIRDAGHPDHCLQWYPGCGTEAKPDSVPGDLH